VKLAPFTSSLALPRPTILVLTNYSREVRVILLIGVELGRLYGQDNGCKPRPARVRCKRRKALVRALWRDRMIVMRELIGTSVKHCVVDRNALTSWHVNGARHLQGVV
jgi:hypothetical protein